MDERWKKMAETLNRYEGFNLTETELQRAITEEIHNGNPRLELNEGAVRVTSGQSSQYNEIYKDNLPSSSSGSVPWNVETISRLHHF